MVRTARSVGVCLLLLSHSVLLHADVIPGRWEKVEAQAPGTGLTVIMKSGDRFDCTFEELQIDTLVVETDAGEKRIPNVDIQRLEASELVPDPVKDGNLKGAVIGVVVLGVLGGLGCGGDGLVVLCDRLTGVTIGAGISAGIGAAIGFTVDKVANHKRPDVLKRPEVLYVAN